MRWQKSILLIQSSFNLICKDLFSFLYFCYDSFAAQFAFEYHFEDYIDTWRINFKTMGTICGERIFHLANSGCGQEAHS